MADPVAVDLRVTIAGIEFKNPVLTASGTFGYGQEFANLVNLDRLGGVVAKGISLRPRAGNPPPRIVETPCGMLNAIGLENVGLDQFVATKLPFLAGLGCKVIVNILGDTIDEYRSLAKALNGVNGIDALEVNISCPNVKHGGVAFGTDPVMAAQVTEAVCAASPNTPVIVKLSPNVTDIALMARAVAEAGADALSLINTLIGMAIDIEQRKPKLANGIGGLSGPAVKPIAVRMVWQAAQAVTIPIIGIGGIANAEDALEFLIAGASAVQVGTMNFVNPKAGEQIIDGLTAYLTRHQLSSIGAIIGAMNR